MRYRQDYFGKLPWEVRGLGNATDERLPEMALDVMGRDEGLPELEKDALDSVFCTVQFSEPNLTRLTTQNSPTPFGSLTTPLLARRIPTIRSARLAHCY